MLEQASSLRVAGTVLAVWTNGWRALEALGVADSLRERFVQLSGYSTCPPSPTLSNYVCFLSLTC